MSDILSWPYFQYIGIGFAVLIAAIICGAALFFLTAVVIAFAPKFHFRKPKMDLVFSTYDAECFTGESDRIKRAEDLRVRHILGMSFRDKWVLGLMTFEKDRP